MFNVGAPEIFVILVVALVVLGPQRLPDAGRQLGKALAEFRRVRATVQEDLREVLDVDDLRRSLDIRTMLEEPPAAVAAGGMAAGMAGGMAAGAGAPSGGSSAVTGIMAPDGAPSIPEGVAIATPTVAVPPPPDAVGRDVLADDTLQAEVLLSGSRGGPADLPPPVFAADRDA